MTSILWANVIKCRDSLKKNRLPVSDAVYKSLEVIIPLTTLFKSVGELKSEGK